MNAKTKAARKHVQTQAPALVTPPAKTRADTSGKAAQQPDKPAQIKKKYCLNKKCGTEITLRNRYGSHGDGYTCCGACERAYDPASLEIQRQKVLHPFSNYTEAVLE